MFQTGNYVICGNNGVCRIDSITTLDISGVDKKRNYYLLKPVYIHGSTVYTPVDTAEDSMRLALTREEAFSFIKTIPDIPLINIENEKFVEKIYKEYLKNNNCNCWIQLIKTIYHRKEKRISIGSKITALDMRYFKLAEENLYGELSVALEMTKDQVREFLVEYLDNYNAPNVCLQT